MMYTEIGFFVVALCGLFCVNGGFQFCTTVDNRRMNVGEEWSNENGCTCTCMAIDNFTFSQCHKCPTIRINEPVESTYTCVINGLRYTASDRWLSNEKECSICRCTSPGAVVCESSTHCTNPCHEGQRAEYGSCCRINNCYGNATIVQQTLNCVLNGSTINHGKSIIKRDHCNDNFCNCNNGVIQCFPFCELPGNNSYKYWDKLCCPRPIGHKTCQTSSDSILGAGETELTIDNKCHCLDGQLYCKKVQVHQTNEATISSRTATSSTVTQIVTASQGLTDTTMKELFIILCLFCFVILVLLAIVFIIRTRYKHRIHRWNRSNRPSLILQDDILDFDINHDYRDGNHV